jgi:hypothetical protein
MVLLLAGIKLTMMMRVLILLASWCGKLLKSYKLAKSAKTQQPFRPLMSLIGSYCIFGIGICGY